MDLVIADKTGLEVTLLKMPYELDLDVGSTNDYQLTVPLEDWNRAGYQKGYQIFVPGTEYGGKIQNIQTQDNSDTAVLSGDIWRGMLLKKIIEPPKGEDYLTVSGEANQILRQVVGERFGTLFSVSGQDSGIVIKTYSFDRYTDLLSGLQKMLSTATARLQITYVRGKPGKPGAVELSAVPVQDLSDSLEYSQDNKVSFLTKDVGNGINHLICLGKGELKDREVLHLYADASGNISETQSLFGEEERAATYDYGSVESTEELRKGGEERLQELMSYKEFSMTVEESTADIGDIVGGREFTTGFLIKQPITQKILRAGNDSWDVEFKVGGSQKNTLNIGRGGTDYGIQIKDLQDAVAALTAQQAPEIVENDKATAWKFADGRLIQFGWAEAEQANEYVLIGTAQFPVPFHGSYIPLIARGHYGNTSGALDLIPSTDPGDEKTMPVVMQRKAGGMTAEENRSVWWMAIGRWKERRMLWS